MIFHSFHHIPHLSLKSEHIHIRLTLLTKLLYFMLLHSSILQLWCCDELLAKFFFIEVCFVTFIRGLFLHRCCYSYYSKISYYVHIGYVYCQNIGGQLMDFPALEGYLTHVISLLLLQNFNDEIYATFIICLYNKMWLFDVN